MKIGIVGLLVTLLLSACGTAPEFAKPNAPSAQPGSGILDPQKGPAYTGYILGNDGVTPVKIQYQVVNGHAIYDGDVGIGAPSEVAKTAAEVLTGARIGPTAVHQTGRSYWADTGGVIPVRRVFAPTNLQAALNQIQQQVPGVKFVNYTGQSHYLTIYYGNGSNYYNGCSGGQCTVYIGSSSASKALIMHELGHALGFQHETRRCDRDSYIRLTSAGYANDQLNKNCNLVKMGSYNYSSIMHYNSREFGSLLFTDLSGRAVNGYWGRTTISASDVTQWRKLYPSTSSSYVTGTTANRDGYTGPYNLRSGPGTNYAIVGSVGGGVRVSIVCQKTGTSHRGPWGSTSLWDKLSSGKWISDAFVYTGSMGKVAPTCK